MKAKFQLYLADLISKITTLRPKLKTYAPFGGYSAHLAASTPGAFGVVDNKMDRSTSSLSLFWDIGVGADEVYSINEYEICTQDWYWPLRKRITKTMKRAKMYTENIIRKLDMIEDHMQYKQPSEFNETHGEESRISELSRPYKTNYECDRMSTRHT